MKTKFTNRDAARWKKIAAICFEDSVKRDKLQKKIGELQAELDNVNARIEMNQATVKLDTGYTTDDLIDRIVEISDKKDKNGYPIKNTKYVLKYPETYVPVPEYAEEPAEMPVDPETQFTNDKPEGHE